MRTVLHLNSRIEATSDRDESSNCKREQRTLHSLPALVTQPTIRHSSDEPAPKAGKSERLDHGDAADPEEICDASLVAQDPGETSGEQPEPKAGDKPAIVIVHSRTVFRDCLAQCLEFAYRDHDVYSFADITEWWNSSKPNALAAAVVIVVIDTINESSVADLEFLETHPIANPVVVVSDIDDLNYIVRVLKSGVRGYIPTSLRFNIAVEAVRLVKAGGVFIPASSFMPGDDEPLVGARNSALLTERQMKVVEEIRHGKANKQIAYELKMSEHTVKVHLRHIMKKLKARNRTEVAVLSETLFSSFRDAPKANPVARSEDDTRTH
jgi:DNA-binding NarL/FixJ family response regulator